MQYFHFRVIAQQANEAPVSLYKLYPNLELAL